MDNEWLTTLEAAALTGYTHRHVRLLAKTGKIESRKFGHVWQVSRLSLVAYVRSIEQLGAKRGPKSGA